MRRGAACARVTEGYPSRAFRFVAEVYGRDAVHEAWEEFVLWRERDPGFDPESPFIPIFMPWLFHRWAPDPQDTAVSDRSLHDRSPTSELIRRQGWKLDPLLRRYLKACCEAPFGFHEILDCTPGVGFRTRDLLLGEEHDVLEASASASMRVGDAIFGQLVSCDGVTLLEACGPRVIPPREKLSIIELRERIRRNYPMTIDTVHEWDAELRNEYLMIHESIVRPVLPVLHNTDGEAILLHEMRFRTGTAQETFDALQHLAHDLTAAELLEEAVHDADGQLKEISFPWTVPGNRQHPDWDNTVMGEIRIDGARMKVEVNSAERAARFLAIADECLGGDARLEGTEVLTSEEAMKARSPDHDPDSETDDLAMDPEVRRRIAEMTVAHHERWVSMEIPALGGETPLEAVRDPVGRERVEALVRQKELNNRRARHPIDEEVFRNLRERLGLLPSE